MKTLLIKYFVNVRLTDVHGFDARIINKSEFANVLKVQCNILMHCRPANMDKVGKWLIERRMDE